MADKNEVITFGKKELNPEEAASYKAKIAKARSGVDSLKSVDPVGGERPNMPDFSQIQGMKGQQQGGLAPDGSVQPRPAGSPVLSPQTAEQLAQMNQAMKNQQEAKPTEEQMKKDIDEDKNDLFEAFDFMGRNEAERVLNNKKRRLDIESRCEPMKLEDLIMADEVKQIVPIIPGKYTVTFRSTSPEENLFIKQFLAKEEAPSESYALEKFSLCQLACALVAINGVEFPDHRKPDGAPDVELFKKKLTQLMKKSGYVIADLGLNYIWFDIRVRKLLSPDKLGNG